MLNPNKTQYLAIIGYIKPMDLLYDKTSIDHKS